MVEARIPPALAVGSVKELIERYSLSPEYIELEITESAYMENPELLISSTEGLKAKGFKILMDDFGSGYSSLNMLRNVPVDILKIDMGFLGEDRYGKGRDILNSVVCMAKAINMETVVEGAENKEQIEMLKQIGCDIVQGYYFAKPMAESEYIKLIESLKM